MLLPCCPPAALPTAKRHGMTRCGCCSPFLSSVHSWTPIQHDVANIIPLLSCSDHFQCFHPHKLTCTEVDCKTSRPNPFFLSPSCLWNACSHHNLLVLSFLCLSEHFCCWHLLLWRCASTPSSLPHMWVGAVSFFPLIAASKTSVIPFPGCQYSRFKLPTGFFLTETTCSFPPPPADQFPMESAGRTGEARSSRQDHETQFFVALPPFPDARSCLCSASFWFPSKTGF